MNIFFIISYNILALIYCACLFPLALTTSTPPKITRPPRLDVFRAARLSPLASVGVLVAGFAMPVFRMVGLIYGLEVGLAQEQIGYYLGAGFLGGALIQIPIGYIADRFDRRLILIFLSLTADSTSSPTSGAPDKPKITTGVEGVAVFTLFPSWSIIALIFPNSCPHKILSPVFIQPF